YCEPQQVQTLGAQSRPAGMTRASANGTTRPLRLDDAMAALGRRADLARWTPDGRVVPRCMARPCGARWRGERANVRAASMYSASNVERFRSGPRWGSARIQG